MASSSIVVSERYAISAITPSSAQLERLLSFISGLNSPFFPPGPEVEKNVEPSLLPFGKLSPEADGCS